jgi:hypothetical protein
MKKKVYRVHKLVRWIQKKYRRRAGIRAARAALLDRYWTILAGQIAKRNDGLEEPDPCAELILRKFGFVQKEVRQELLREWLHAAARLYGAAFHQWRMMYAESDRCDKESCQELVAQELRGIGKSYGQHEYELELRLPENQFELTEEFKAAFGDLLFDGQNHNITECERLGLPDPFPAEQTEAQKHTFSPDPADRVYTDEAFTGPKVPRLKYLPSRAIMLKLMRACIQLSEPSELWYKC